MARCVPLLTPPGCSTAALGRRLGGRSYHSERWPEWVARRPARSRQLRRGPTTAASGAIPTTRVVAVAAALPGALPLADDRRRAPAPDRCDGPRASSPAPAAGASAAAADTAVTYEVGPCGRRARGCRALFARRTPVFARDPRLGDARRGGGGAWRALLGAKLPARRLACRPLKVLVTGAPGFIGSHFVKRPRGGRRRVRRARQAHLRRQPGNLEGVDASSSSATSRTPRRSRARRRAATRSSTSPPRRTSTAPSSSRQAVIRHERARAEARSSGRARTMTRLLQVSTRRGLRRRRSRRGAAPGGRTTAAVQPVQRAKAGGDLPCPRTSAPTASTRCALHGANTYGSHQYPRSSCRCS
jgi:hypothetical protein